MKEVWEETNKNLYGTTPEEWTEKCRKKLLLQVTYFYRHKVRLVSQFNQNLFRVGLNERERESPERLERWIDMIKAEKTNKIEQQNTLIKQHKKITFYFRPATKLQEITAEETKDKNDYIEVQGAVLDLQGMNAST